MADNSVAGLQQRYGDRWRWLAVATVMAGTMSTVLSATVVNVALYDIMLEFGVRQGQIHWLATGFIAAMTTTMLASSWLLDHFGIRKTLVTAMALFTVISVLGGFVASPEQLIAARIGQGAMAGLMQPMAMFLVFRIFPRNQRGQAMGIYGMGLALFGSTYLIPLFAQTALGSSATEAGLLMLPAGIVLGIVFPVAGNMADKHSSRKLVIFGILAFTLSATLFALSGFETPLGWLALWAAVGRVGIGFMLPALSMGALNPLAPEELGAGSSTISFTRQLGGAFGVNMVALAIEHGDHRNGMPTVEAFQFAWWMVAVFLALAIIPVWKMRT